MTGFCGRLAQQFINTTFVIGHPLPFHTATPFCFIASSRVRIIWRQRILCPLPKLVESSSNLREDAILTFNGHQMIPGVFERAEMGMVGREDSLSQSQNLSPSQQKSIKRPALPKDKHPIKNLRSQRLQHTTFYPCLCQTMTPNWPSLDPVAILRNRRT